MRRARPVCITAAPGELKEGLFGGIFIYLLEILPYLKRRGVRPRWSIASLLYGDDPDCVTIPGVLDLAYAPPAGPAREVRLMEVKRRHNVALGSDWPVLHDLWSSFFRVPARIAAIADAQGDLQATLGVHYRGGDKNTASWDSNPVSHDDFLAIVADFLKRPHRFARLFVATDDAAFVARMASATGLPVLNLGQVRQHTNLQGQSGRAAEADRALLDCLVLSRCGAVLSTSSALSAFAKVLNPGLEIYRSAASKLFADIPYFPVAYIEMYRTEDPQVQAILDRTMADDWTRAPAGVRFLRPFAFRARRPWRSRAWRLLELARPLL